jgi:hypothetical protein
MKYLVVGLIAILIAGVFVFSAVPVSSLDKALGLSSNPDRNKNEVKDNDDLDDEDDDENETGLAGGGGWCDVNMSGSMLKDTFGVYISGNLSNTSSNSFVFQARDQDATIHSRNFTDLQVDNTTEENVTYVHAWGWATYDKYEGFWFHLVLKDNGTRANDLFELWLYKDGQKDWTMDEADPILHWVFDGLDGGNIWVNE